MARQTYTKSVEEWKNKPDKTTPILAENLNHIEEGIKIAMDDRALREIYGDENLVLNGGFSSPKVYGSKNIVAGAYYDVGSSSASPKYNINVGLANNLKSGDGNAVIGNGNVVERCNYSTISGYENKVGKSESLMSGTAVFGSGNISQSSNQTVIGKYNVQEDSPLIVGGGLSNSARLNLLSLDWNGNMEVSGDVTTKSGASLNAIGIPANTDIDFSNYFL